jgi:regulator of sigma E protease
VLQETIAERLGEDIALQVERAGEELTLNLVPRTEFPDDQGPIGITLGNPARPTNWPEAAQLGVQSTFLQIRAMVTLPGRLIQGEIAPEEARVSGLRGMYDMFDWAGEIDRSSQRPFLTLNLIGVISAGLALLNLMPIPALDGGRMMFVLFEAVTGKRLSPQQEGLAHTIGFMLLLVLILYINIQDFVNPINLPR